MITKLGEEIICNNSGYISKKRVREVIEKIFDRAGVIIEYPKGTNYWKFSEIKEELLKELGLLKVFGMELKLDKTLKNNEFRLEEK